MRVVIAVFEEVDLLDVGGPYEVFLTASRLAERGGDEPPFEVKTAGPARVRAYGGLGLHPDAELAAVGRVDLLVVPGAIDIDAARSDDELMRDLRKTAEQADVVASVCTGAFLLAEIGMLPESWTTHWEDIDALEAIAPGRGQRSVRWVDTGTVVTGGGLSSGIAMALHLVDRFSGRELAERTARQIDYVWDPSGTSQAT